MEGFPLISVIIPVYNVEKYLPLCVDSVREQTYSNLEIILVDDGAKDSSGKICDEYAIMDHRIICIHKKNGGLSDARNVGIEKSTGEYITFIDSDDYVDSRFIEVLFENIKKTNADLSISNFERVYEGEKRHFTREKGDIKVFTKEEAFYALFKDEYKYQFTIACGKLYNRTAMGSILFPKGRNFEDSATAHLFIANANTIVYSNRKQYFYLTRQGSITQSQQHIKDDVIVAMKERVVFFEKIGYLDLATASRKQYIITMMGVHARLHNRNIEEDTKKRKLLIYDAVKKEFFSHYKSFIRDRVFIFRVLVFLGSPYAYRVILEYMKSR